MGKPAEYDAISKAYASLVHHDPSKRYVQYPWALAQMPADLRGLRILDIGCGEGSVSRILASRGAAVVGYDNSPAQIELARTGQKPGEPPVEFLVADPRDVESRLEPSSFDIALAVTVLHYAEDLSHLSAFFSSTMRLLRPGGWFAALVTNPDFRRFGEIAYRRRYVRESPGRLRADFFDESGLVCSAHYSDFSRSDYEMAANAAGFAPLEWLPIVVTPQGRTDLGAFWDGLDDDCPYAGFKTQKKEESVFPLA